MVEEVRGGTRRLSAKEESESLLQYMGYSVGAAKCRGARKRRIWRAFIFIFVDGAGEKEGRRVDLSKGGVLGRKGRMRERERKRCDTRSRTRVNSNIINTKAANMFRLIWSSERKADRLNERIKGSFV